MRIRQGFGVGAGLGVTLTLVAACAAKKPAPFPDVSSFCNAKAQAECQIATTCLIDSTECQAERASLCNTDAMQAMASGAGTRKYTQANAQACIDIVNDAYGNGHTAVAYAQLVGQGSITDVCERVFSGNAAMNDPCESSYDCTGDFVCAPATPGTTQLVCAPVTQVPGGQFCTTPGSVCAPDTYCAMPSAGSAFVCKPAMNEGQPCAGTTPCVSTARCEMVGVTGQTCTPRAMIGEACLTSDDCVPSAPYCDPYVGHICTTGQSFAAHAPDCDAFTSGAASPDAGAAQAPPEGGAPPAASDAAAD